MASATESPSASDLLATMPYAAGLGVHLTSATPPKVQGHLEWRADLCTVGGVLHGGALMSLADAVGAVCGFLNLPEEAAGTSTVDSATHFFRAVRGGTVHAVAVPMHVGRSFVVVQTDLYDDEERRVGRTTQTQAVLMPRRADPA